MNGGNNPRFRGQPGRGFPSSGHQSFPGRGNPGYHGGRGRGVIGGRGMHGGRSHPDPRMPRGPLPRPLHNFDRGVHHPGGPMIPGNFHAGRGPPRHHHPPPPPIMPPARPPPPPPPPHAAQMNHHYPPPPHIPPPAPHYPQLPPPAPPALPVPPPVQIPAPPPPVQLSVDDAWTEHTAENSMKYYFNSVSGKSEWEKPQVLKDREATQVWKEYTEAVSGKIYYSDGRVARWDKPAGFGEDSTDTADAAPPKKKRKTTQARSFASKAEAITAFKELLLAKQISPTMKWNEVVKALSSDDRWDECEEFLKTGERRQALAEYQTKRTSDLRTMERQERQRARDAFNRMLAELLPGSSPWNKSFDSVRDSLSSDDRFHAVTEEATRQSLFQEFCEECRKREERKLLKKRLDTIERFREFLTEKIQEEKLDLHTLWPTFLSSLGESDLQDDRFAVSSDICDSDRKLFFADFIAERRSQENERMRKEQEEERRAQNELRWAFKSTLAEMARNGDLSESSHWRTIEPLVEEKPSLTALLERDRGAPRQIFEEFVEGWSEQYRKDRKYLSRALSLVEPPLTVAPDTTYEDFTKKLLGGLDDSTDTYRTVHSIVERSDPISGARQYFDELLLRAKSEPTVRHGSMRRPDYESSEDEGEIVEDD